MVFMVKYAFIIIPALVARSVIGKVTDNKKKNSDKK